jgi:hypothetical protein
MRLLQMTRAPSYLVCFPNKTSNNQNVHFLCVFVFFKLIFSKGYLYNPFCEIPLIQSLFPGGA